MSNRKTKLIRCRVDPTMKEQLLFIAEQESKDYSDVMREALSMKLRQFFARKVLKQVA